jgi:hypothetical protein
VGQFEFPLLTDAVEKVGGVDRFPSERDGLGGEIDAPVAFSLG